MFPQNPWELSANPLESAKHTLGTNGICDKIFIFEINIRLVIGVVKQDG